MMIKFIMNNTESESFDIVTTIINQTLLTHTRKYLNQNLFKHEQIYDTAIIFYDIR